MKNGNNETGHRMTLKRPLVWTAILFASGAWWGVGHAAERPVFGWVGCIAATWAVVVFFLSILKDKGLKPIVRVAALVAISTLAAFLGSNAINPPLPDNHISHRIVSHKTPDISVSDDIGVPAKNEPVVKAKVIAKQGGVSAAPTVDDAGAPLAAPQSTDEEKPRGRARLPSLAGAPIKAVRLGAMIGKGDSRLPGHAVVKGLRASVKVGRVKPETAESNEVAGAPPAAPRPNNASAPPIKNDSRKKDTPTKRKPGRVLAKAFIVAIKSGAVPQRRDAPSSAQSRTVPKTMFMARLVESPMRHSDRTYLILEAEQAVEGDRRAPVCGRMRVSVMQDVPKLSFGDRILLKIALKGAENFSNPGGFDYERHLAAQGIFARGSLTSGGDIIVLREWPPRKANLRERVEQVRENISDWIGRVGEGGPMSEVMRALVVGDRWAAPEDVNDVFQRAGVAHLLAVSGLHLGLVASIVYFIALMALKSSERLMMAMDVRRVAAALTILPVIAYMLLAGSRIPTIRSAIMVCTYMIAVVIGRDDDLPSAIALAALAIMILWPASVVDVGFILSFGAVIAIAFMMPTIRNILGYKNPEEREKLWWRLKSNIASGFMMSAGIMLFTSPFVARYFNYFIPISPISNLIFIPLVGYGALPLGLMASLMHPVWPAGGDWLMFMGLKTIEYSIGLMKYFAMLSAPDRLVPTPTALETVLVMSLTVAAAKALGRGGRARNIARFATLILALALVADGGVWYLLGKGRGDLRITYLDVGEGNAAVAVMPDGKVLVVDTGPIFGGFDAGERIVGPYLLHERITRIDTIAISHPHSDHVGGLKWLADHFRVGEIWMADIGYSEDDVNKITDPAAKRGVPVRRLSVKTPPFDYGGARVDVWWPPRGAEVEDLNNASLVFRIRFGGASFLFPGDVGERVHEEMLDGGGERRVTVLLAPHHGSRHGVTDLLLARLTPSWAVISSRYSMYSRFPSPEALAVLKRAGIRALRTDELGAIRFRTDGARMEVSAWDGDRMRRVIQ